MLEFVEREGVNADPGDLERRMGVLDRILGDPGDPVAPQAAVERLLDIAPSLRECDTVIIEDFLGVEDDY